MRLNFRISTSNEKRMKRCVGKSMLKARQWMLLSVLLRELSCMGQKGLSIKKARKRDYCHAFLSFTIFKSSNHV